MTPLGTSSFGLAGLGEGGFLHYTKVTSQSTFINTFSFDLNNLVLSLVPWEISLAC